MATQFRGENNSHNFFSTQNSFSDRNRVPKIKVKLMTAESKSRYGNGGHGSVYEHEETQPRDEYT